jgi:glutaredoxin
MNNHHQQALQDQIDSAPVVIFRSSLTEMVALRRALDELNIDYLEIEFGMADQVLRERFHCLQALTSYQQLPQVFINSKFVGGGDAAIHSDELMQLANLRSDN